MSSLFRRLDAAFFAPVPAVRLALLRILVGVWVLEYLRRRRRMLRQVAQTDPSLFRPVGTARVLERPLSPEAARALFTVTEAAGAAFVLGLCHRVSGPLFAGSLLSTLSYRNSWSMIFHNDNVLVLHALVLGLAPCADALSFDRVLTARGAPNGRRPPGSPLSPVEGWQYGWPIRLMNAVTASTYFLAGVAKVKGPLGLGWAQGDSLRSQVAMDGLRKELLGEGAAPLSFRLHKHVFLFRLLAVGSLVTELGAPLALVDRRLARAWAANAFLMHWGIFFVMRIRFRYQQSGLQFAPFFPLEQVTAVPALLKR